MGGTIAFRIAAQRPQDVAFVLSLAGAAIPGKDLMMHQCEKIILSQLPATTSDSLRTLYEELYGTMALPLRSTPHATGALLSWSPFGSISA